MASGFLESREQGQPKNSRKAESKALSKALMDLGLQVRVQLHYSNCKIEHTKIPHGGTSFVLGMQVKRNEVVPHCLYETLPAFGMRTA